MATKEDLMKLSAPWQIPQAYKDFMLSDCRIKTLSSLLDNPYGIHIERNIFSERLDAIESGMYYRRQSMITNNGETVR